MNQVRVDQQEDRRLRWRMMAMQWAIGSGRGTQLCSKYRQTTRNGDISTDDSVAPDWVQTMGRFREVGAEITPVAEHIKGLIACNCTSCVIHGPQIARAHMVRLTKMLRYHMGYVEKGYRAYLITFTTRHSVDDRLDDLMTAVKKGMARVTGGSSWERDRRDFGIAGYVLGTEVPRSIENGWHPHVHAIVMTTREWDKEEFELLEGRLFDRWSAGLLKSGAPGIKPPSRDRGIDVRRISSWRGVPAYLVKMGAEIRAADVGDTDAEIDRVNRALIGAASEITRGDHKSGRTVGTESLRDIEVRTLDAWEQHPWKIPRLKAGDHIRQREGVQKFFIETRAGERLSLRVPKEGRDLLEYQVAMRRRNLITYAHHRESPATVEDEHWNRVLAAGNSHEDNLRRVPIDFGDDEVEYWMDPLSGEIVSDETSENDQSIIGTETGMAFMRGTHFDERCRFNAAMRCQWFEANDAGDEAVLEFGRLHGWDVITRSEYLWIMSDFRLSLHQDFNTLTSRRVERRHPGIDEDHVNDLVVGIMLERAWPELVARRSNAKYEIYQGLTPGRITAERELPNPDRPRRRRAALSDAFASATRPKARRDQVFYDDEWY